MLLFVYLFVFYTTFVCCKGRIFPIEHNCVSSCSSYTCVTNKTLCQINTFLSQCGCCHLCVKRNLEFCGGLFGRYGVCGKGLRCTVNEKAALRGEFRGVGICRRELLFIVYPIFCFITRRSVDLFMLSNLHFAIWPGLNCWSSY